MVADKLAKTARMARVRMRALPRHNGGQPQVVPLTVDPAACFAFSAKKKRKEKKRKEKKRKERKRKEKKGKEKKARATSEVWNVDERTSIVSKQATTDTTSEAGSLCQRTVEHT